MLLGERGEERRFFRSRDNSYIFNTFASCKANEALEEHRTTLDNE